MTVPTNEQVEAMIAKLRLFDADRYDPIMDEAADMLAALMPNTNQPEARAEIERLKDVAAHCEDLQYTIGKLVAEIAALKAAQMAYRGQVVKAVRRLGVFGAYDDFGLGEWMDSIDAALAEQTKGDDAK